MTDDPWANIPSPSVAGAISARRVSADNPWNFFWARSLDQRQLLTLEHKKLPILPSKLPRLRGIEVADVESGESGDYMFVLKLLDAGLKDVFYRLCNDIIASTASAGSENAAVGLAIARTWRWHYLLRGGSADALSLEEQKGLIGELLVLERFLLPRFSAHDALTGWHGPLGAPKDFEIGTVCIEVKARRAAATPYVSISSEFQLDASEPQSLFLFVIDLHAAPAGSAGTVSISELANRVRVLIQEGGDGSEMDFESLLSAAGFRWDDDYSDTRWIEGTNRLYRVADDFPRIASRHVAVGVSDVKYRISLSGLGPFQADISVLEAALGTNYGD